MNQDVTGAASTPVLDTNIYTTFGLGTGVATLTFDDSRIKRRAAIVGGIAGLVVAVVVNVLFSIFGG